MISRLMRLVAGICLACLLATIAMAWMAWRRVPAGPARLFGMPFRGDRYTVGTGRGRILIFGPPPPAPTDPPAVVAAVEKMVSGIGNEQIVWEVTGLVGPDGRRRRPVMTSPPRVRKGSSLDLMPYDQEVPVFPTAAVRRLLAALDDPKRCVAADLLLMRIDQAIATAPYIPGSNYDRDVEWTRTFVWPADGANGHGEWYGQRMELVATDRVRDGDIFGEYVAECDVRVDAAWMSDVRNAWHRRLDVLARDDPLWPAIVLSAVLPLLWLLVRMHCAAVGRRRRRLSLCLTCGYDLRHSPAQCPECGTMVGGPVGRRDSAGAALTSPSPQG